MGLELIKSIQQKVNSENLQWSYHAKLPHYEMQNHLPLKCDPIGQAIENQNSDGTIRKRHLRNHSFIPVMKRKEIHCNELVVLEIVLNEILKKKYLLFYCFFDLFAVLVFNTFANLQVSIVAVNSRINFYFGQEYYFEIRFQLIHFLKRIFAKGSLNKQKNVCVP